MLYFLTCVGLLILGYFTYGYFVEKIFGIDPARKTPCWTKEDGVDYVNMPTWKVFFIQLLDIAGLGPIFGPILGALYGPQALIWIVVGSILAGGVHDYFSGMLSVRSGGKSIPEVVGDEMGQFARQIMRAFSVLLLLLVGVVFILGPAKLLGTLTGFNVQLLVAVIFVYYFIATILPIDKIIGSLYPIFGALLMFMTIGITVGLIYHGYEFLPNKDFSVNVHPGDLPLFPLLFITLSCGALSGFHSTQSPLMARCMRNERNGRPIFYGAMIAEGIIGLVWATAGMSFYESPEALNAVIASGSPAAVVNDVSTFAAGNLWRLPCHHGRDRSADHQRGYGLPLNPSHSGGNLQTGSDPDRKTPVDRPAAVRHCLLDQPRRLQHHLALFRLVQPDLGDAGALECGHLAGTRGQVPLDCHGACRLHDRC